MLAAISIPRLTHSAKLLNLTMKETIKYITYIVHVSVFSNVPEQADMCHVGFSLPQLSNVCYS